MGAGERGPPFLLLGFPLGYPLAFREKGCALTCESLKTCRPSWPAFPPSRGNTRPPHTASSMAALGAGVGTGGPGEAGEEAAHTRRHGVLPSAPSFPANLGAPASLLLLGLPLG